MLKDIVVLLKKLVKFYATNKKAWVLIIAPLVLMILPIVDPGPKSQTAFVLLLMAVYLIFEVLPIGITGLIPMLFIPLFGIIESKKLSGKYMEDFMVLFLCSMSIAALMEKTNFHRRIALNTMRVVGDDIGRLLFGFTFVAWFFSMWMSNTATTAMVLPIIEALVLQKKNDMKLRRRRARTRAQSQLAVLHGPNHDITEISDVTLDTAQSNEEQPVPMYDVNRAAEAETNFSKVVPIATTYYDDAAQPSLAEVESQYKAEEESIEKMQKMLIMSVAFTASIGGVVTITGTSTNLILISVLGPYPGHPLTFSSWLIFALPMSFCVWIALWFWMMFMYCGYKAIITSFTFRCRGPPQPKSPSRLFLEEECRRLGPFRFEEGCTVFYFVILISLWMSRELGDAGWHNWFRDGYVTETQAGIAIVILCCMTPALSQVKLDSGSSSVGPHDSNPEFEKQSEAHENHGKAKAHHESSFHQKFLLSWSDISAAVPWELYFLIGGGVAVSEASKESGLSAWIGEQLKILQPLDPVLILTIICYLSAALTQVMSNTAVCSILMPILLSMSQQIGINPLFVMFPATISCSLAFLLPIATPPNTLAYASGHITTFEMIKAGSGINLVAVAILIVCVITYGTGLIPARDIPAMLVTNATSVPK